LKEGMPFSVLSVPAGAKIRVCNDLVR